MSTPPPTSAAITSTPAAAIGRMFPLSSRMTEAGLDWRRPGMIFSMEHVPFGDQALRYDAMLKYILRYI